MTGNEILSSLRGAICAGISSCAISKEHLVILGPLIQFIYSQKTCTYFIFG
jgi:hypothetical protein